MVSRKLFEGLASSLVSSVIVGGDRVALALDDHQHQWVRLPDTVGLFACTHPACLWVAVCPGCLHSLDVALRARAGIAGLALFWCPVHGGEDGA